MSTRVLIIDDSAYMRSQIRDALVREGLEVIAEAKDGVSGIDLAIELKPDLITLDNMLPDMSGVDVLTVLNKELTTKVIMISAVGQLSVIKESLRQGASDYIVKPFTQEELQKVLKKIMR